MFLVSSQFGYDLGMLVKFGGLYIPLRHSLIIKAMVMMTISPVVINIVASIKKRLHDKKCLIELG